MVESAGAVGGAVDRQSQAGVPAAEHQAICVHLSTGLKDDGLVFIVFQTAQSVEGGAVGFGDIVEEQLQLKSMRRRLPKCSAVR